MGFLVVFGRLSRIDVGSWVRVVFVKLFDEFFVVLKLFIVIFLGRGFLCYGFFLILGYCRYYLSG